MSSRSPGKLYTCGATALKYLAFVSKVLVGFIPSPTTLTLVMTSSDTR